MIEHKETVKVMIELDVDVTVFWQEETYDDQDGTTNRKRAWVEHIQLDSIDGLHNTMDLGEIAEKVIDGLDSYDFDYPGDQ